MLGRKDVPADISPFYQNQNQKIVALVLILSVVSIIIVDNNSCYDIPLKLKCKLTKFTTLGCLTSVTTPPLM